MALVDRKGRIVLVNTKTEKIFGYGSEALVGEPVEKFMPERLRSGHLVHQSQYAATPHTRPMGTGLELFGQRQDGHEFPIEISLALLETEDGGKIADRVEVVIDLKATQVSGPRLVYQE